MTREIAHPDARLFPGALSAYATNVAWADALDGVQAQPREDALVLLNRFHRSVAGPWPAACSLWAQLYFNGLLIPALCLASDGDRARSTVGAITGCFCPDSGAPVRFALHRQGARRAASSNECFVQLLAAHLRAVIDVLHRDCGLSRRMLEESAERTATWTLEQIGLADRIRMRRTAALLARADLAPRHAPGLDGGVAATPRRLCCLRYRLPGFAACPDICPRAQCARRRSPS